MTQATDITSLLADWREGNRNAFDQLFPLVYQELRKLAGGQLRRFYGIDTISPTALVNEAFLKLVDHTQAHWQDREHFLAVAATAMRHILINYAKHKRCAKRGGDWLQVTYNEAGLSREIRADTLLRLDEALQLLGQSEPRLAKVVELRFFGGLTEPEIATVLKMNERTARRDWQKAKALLSLSMRAAQESPPASPMQRPSIAQQVCT